MKIIGIQGCKKVKSSFDFAETVKQSANYFNEAEDWRNKNNLKMLFLDDRCRSLNETKATAKLTNLVGKYLVIFTCRQKRHDIKGQKGRSMIEMLGVLAIIGVLSIGGLAGYSKAIDKYKTNETILQVTQTAQNIRDLFRNQKNYIGPTPANLSVFDSKTKIVPEKIRETGYINLFNGWFKINSFGRFKSDDGKAFLITLSAIPGDICINLVTHDWGNTDLGKLRIRSHSIGSFPNTFEMPCVSTYENLIGVICTSDLPLSPSQAAKVCDSEKLNRNVIEWIFY